jgi:hypothetical protein
MLVTDGKGQSPGSLDALAAGVFEAAKEAHRRFQAERWETNEDAGLLVDGHRQALSYHNAAHIAAVVACIREVIASLRLGSDPLLIGDAMELWERGAAPRVASLDAFASAADIAFACHELGNITSSAGFSLGSSGMPELDFSRVYDSSSLYSEPAVEVRSADVTSAILAASCGDRETLGWLDPLVRHLILQTVFRFEVSSSTEPFWLLMQVVDMIGSYFYSETARTVLVAGLFNEMRVQRPGSVIPVNFLTSLDRRFRMLIQDVDRRKAVVEIFERNPCGRTAEAVLGVPGRFYRHDRPVPYEDAMLALLRDA